MTTPNDPNATTPPPAGVQEVDLVGTLEVLRLALQLPAVKAAVATVLLFLGCAAYALWRVAASPAVSPEEIETITIDDLISEEFAGDEVVIVNPYAKSTTDGKDTKDGTTSIAPGEIKSYGEVAEEEDRRKLRTLIEDVKRNHEDLRIRIRDAIAHEPPAGLTRTLAEIGEDYDEATEVERELFRDELKAQIELLYKLVVESENLVKLHSPYAHPLLKERARRFHTAIASELGKAAALLNRGSSMSAEEAYACLEARALAANLLQGAEQEWHLPRGASLNLPTLDP